MPLKIWHNFPHFRKTLDTIYKNLKILTFIQLIILNFVKFLSKFKEFKKIWHKFVIIRFIIMYLYLKKLNPTSRNFAFYRILCPYLKLDQILSN